MSEPRRAWLPLAVVAGTTVVLAVPLVCLVRRRPPPPATAASAVNFARGRTNPTTITPSSSSPPSPSSSSLPGLFSALSQSDASTALSATKALGIATCIVAASGLGIAWGVKSVLGVHDMHEFTHLAREAVSTRFPSLSARLYRQPQSEAERAPPPSGIPASWDVERVMKQMDSDLEYQHQKKFKQ